MPNYQIQNIAIGSLKPHEEICPLHLKNLRAEIKKDGCVRDPIIADKNTLVILDGHHRWNSLKSLGAKLCPVCLVDYQSGEIGVGSLRRDEKNSQKKGLPGGMNGGLFFPKNFPPFFLLPPPRF